MRWENACGVLRLLTARALLSPLPSHVPPSGSPHSPSAAEPLGALPARSVLLVQLASVLRTLSAKIVVTYIEVAQSPSPVSVLNQSISCLLLIVLYAKLATILFFYLFSGVQFSRGLVVLKPDKYSFVPHQC